METKKRYKALKKEIVYNTAVVEDFKVISLNGLISSSSNESEISNMVITESIRFLNFQDFKNLAPYFFNFKR